MRPLLVISFFLAFVGGYADACGYVLAKSFTGHLTGNTVLTMVHLSQGTWRAAGTNVLAVVCFVCGTVVADWMPTNAGVPAHARQLRAPLALQGLLLLGAVGSLAQGGQNSATVCLGLLCLGMGLQNGALRKCDTISIHTTFITGMSTSLLANALQGPTGKQDADSHREHSLGLWIGVIVVFAVGALVGGFFSGRYGVAGLAGIFVPWAAALLISIVQPKSGHAG